MSIAATDLRAAATRIETLGWVQGMSVAPARYVGEPRDERPSCAGNALTMESGFDPEARRAMIRRVGSIVRWNDKPGQTSENVIRTMRELADELDARDQS